MENDEDVNHPLHSQGGNSTIYGQRAEVIFIEDTEILEPCVGQLKTYKRYIEVSDQGKKEEMDKLVLKKVNWKNK